MQQQITETTNDAQEIANNIREILDWKRRYANVDWRRQYPKVNASYRRYKECDRIEDTEGNR